MRRRVVVTGLGAVTPVGNDVATTWQSLLSGVSGGADITKFDASKYSVRFACEVKQFDPLAYMDRKEAKRADVYAHYAVAASLQAAADAGIVPGAIDPDTMGVIIGSGIGGIRSFEDQHDVYRTLGPSKISPFFIPMFIGDIAAGIVSMRLQAKGPNYATVSACASSAHAIGDAFRILQRGDADLVALARSFMYKPRWGWEAAVALDGFLQRGVGVEQVVAAQFVELVVDLVCVPAHGHVSVRCLGPDQFRALTTSSDGPTEPPCRDRNDHPVPQQPPRAREVPLLWMHRVGSKMRVCGDAVVLLGESVRLVRGPNLRATSATASWVVWYGNKGFSRPLMWGSSQLFAFSAQSPPLNR